MPINCCVCLFFDPIGHKWLLRMLYTRPLCFLQCLNNLSSLPNLYAPGFQPYPALTVLTTGNHIFRTDINEDMDFNTHEDGPDPRTQEDTIENPE